MRRGLILLGHGARDPRWREPFERLLERISAMRPELEARLAFLELMSPDVVTAGTDLVAAGCEALVVVPVFFGQGGHVRTDVPALVEALRARCPGVTVVQSRSAGENVGVLDALAAFCVAELERSMMSTPHQSKLT